MRLTNSDYEAVMRDYDSIRYKNADIMHRRMQEVFEKVPELKALADEMVSDFAKLARDSILLSDSAYAARKKELDKKASAIRKSKEKLLAANGFAKDYLEEIYSCPLCKDTGFVTGHKCSCFKALASKHIYSGKNFIMSDKNADFKYFREDYYKDSPESRENALNAFRSLKKMADDFESYAQSFVIYGGVGVGKTFLASCLANSLIKSGHSVVFLTAFRFFDLFEKNAFRKDEDDEAAAPSIKPVFDCDLLVIDDIGTEISNAFTSSRLFDCINERILSGRPTIISTNFGPDLIKKTYSDRIFSRLVGNYKLLALTGHDARMA